MFTRLRDSLVQVKAYFKHVVDSFEVSTDELEDKEKLLLSVQRSRAMWQRMRECTTEDPAQSVMARVVAV